MYKRQGGVPGQLSVPTHLHKHLRLIAVGPVSYTHLDVYKRQPISRADAAVVLAKLLPESGGAAASSFTDELPQYAAQSIAKLQNLGILYGYGDGSFRPSNMLTKAECAAMLDVYKRQNQDNSSIS